MGEEPDTEELVMTDKARAAADDLQRRVEARVARGLSRDKATMLTIMEMGGKISIVKG